MDQIDVNMDSIRQVEAKVKLIGKQFMVSHGALSSAYFPEMAVEQAMQEWVIMFRKHIPCVELANERWPVDWWQAVRERWLPQWWLKKHPVQYRHVQVDAALNIAIRSRLQGSRFILTVNDMLVPAPAEDRQVQ